MTKNIFEPVWRETPPAEKSYRSIFKWGDPAGYKHPNKKLFKEIKEQFNLTDNDFRSVKTTGDETVNFKKKPAIKAKTIEAFEKICGKENVSLNEYDRLKYSTGKTVEEAIALRSGKPGPVSDLVIHPKSKTEIAAIIKLCNKEKIPVYVYGGGSSVNFGFRPSLGGITLVMNTLMNRIVEVNDLNQTVTVEAGIMGPDLENALNNAKEVFKLLFNCCCCSAFF